MAGKVNLALPMRNRRMTTDSASGQKGRGGSGAGSVALRSRWLWVTSPKVRALTEACKRGGAPRASCGRGKNTSEAQETAPRIKLI